MRNKRKIKKIKFRTVPALGLAFSILMVGSVFVSIGVSSRGSELVEIEEKMSEVSAGNRELRMQMVNETSLINVAAEAERLGLIKPERIVYLGGSDKSQDVLARAN